MKYQISHISKQQKIAREHPLAGLWGFTNRDLSIELYCLTYEQLIEMHRRFNDTMNSLRIGVQL